MLMCTDSIILAAQALAGGIVKFYNDSLSVDGIPGLFPDPYFWYEGGMIFNALIDYSYLTGDKQNGAANGDFFLLGARLAKFTGNETYSEWADKSFTWAKDIGIIDDEYAVFDGGDATDDCRDINGFRWTNLHAAYTEGSAIMQNIVSTS